jgi:hypothetical protein
MTDNQDQKYHYYTKVTWAIYALIVLVLATVLVLFVARDNEERFFYGFMTVAGAYVLRPTEKHISNIIFKFTGVSRTTEQD